MKPSIIAVLGTTVLCGVVGSAPPSNLLPLVGQATGRVAYTYSVQQHQGTAYVLNENGVDLYDVTQEAPVYRRKLVGGNPRFAVVEDNMLYISHLDSRVFFGYSLTDPANPTMHSMARCPGQTKPGLFFNFLVTATSGHIITGCGDNEHFRLMFLAKGSLVETGHLDIPYNGPGRVSSMTHHNGVLYVRENPNKVHVIDITDPAHPSKTSTWELPEHLDINHITYHDGVLYATEDLHDMLYKYDAATGARQAIELPAEFTARCSAARYVAVHTSRVYVSCFSGGLFVLEQPTADTYTLAYHDPTLQRALGLYFSDAQLYAAGYLTWRIYNVPLFQPGESAEPTAVPTLAPTPAPVFKQHLGCFKTMHRFLPKRVYHGDSNTPSECANLCTAAGHAYAGVEYGKECWCGSSVEGSKKTVSTDCNVPCTGDDTEMCGGGHRMNLYSLVAKDPQQTPSRLGCFEVDGWHRALHTLAYVSQGNTMEECTSACQWNGFKYAGLEAGDECWCGNNVQYASRTITAKCDTPCPGDGNQWCGDGYKSLVYILDGSVYTPPTATYQGCYTDSKHFRALPEYAYSSDSNTIEECTGVCYHNGYAYAGVQYGEQCWCGNRKKHRKTSESQCATPCTGDSTQTCGGSRKNSLYKLG
eukprot:TRINITY_DN3514_c0_g1_i1.p1 TRINITY_DN3514_c0_g1~~TRINITY_DN3514_c0_g1_i1.p1  ORF type:complete len:666 (+),score=165.37 TRINITY_DN3514_c0_g1_i1:68-1999(+)